MERLIRERRELAGGSFHCEALRGVDRFVECGSRVRLGHGKDSVGNAVCKARCDVVADHETVLRIGEPGELHRSGESGRSVPRASAIRRGNVSNEKLARCGHAVTLRIVVVMQGDVSSGARCRGIDSDAGDEVVDCGRDVIDWNAGDSAPGRTVGGGAVDEIVSRAACAKAAVFPHNPDRSGSVDCRRRERTAANASGIGV